MAILLNSNQGGTKDYRRAERLLSRLCMTELENNFNYGIEGEEEPAWSA